MNLGEPRDLLSRSFKSQRKNKEPFGGVAGVFHGETVMFPAGQNSPQLLASGNDCYIAIEHGPVKCWEFFPFNMAIVLIVMLSDQRVRP